MTGDGTVIASLAAGVAHNAAGNANTASTSTDNSVTYDGTRPTVTINQASTQADPTASSTIHFTVVFSEAVSDFVAGDVTFGGTVVGNLTGTVTATGSDGTTYDVAVVGMATNGTVTATIPAYKAHDAAGNGNIASTSTDNTVQFVLAQTPTFTLTVPTSGTLQRRTDRGDCLEGHERHLRHLDLPLLRHRHRSGAAARRPGSTFNQATAVNGYGTYQWNTTGVAPGTYYIGGYLWSGGKPIYSHLTQSITILGPRPADLRPDGADLRELHRRAKRGHRLEGRQRARRRHGQPLLRQGHGLGRRQRDLDHFQSDRRQRLRHLPVGHHRHERRARTTSAAICRPTASRRTPTLPRRSPSAAAHRPSP